MQGMGAQVALELTQALLAVREEHELLVVPQALAIEHCGQVSLGSGSWPWTKPKRFVGPP
jgi:hypothetical protein